MAEGERAAEWGGERIAESAGGASVTVVAGFGEEALESYWRQAVQLSFLSL
jgi:hypothetical protein